MAFMAVSESTESEPTRQLDLNLGVTMNQMLAQQQQNNSAVSNVYIGNGVPNPRPYAQQSFQGMNYGAGYNGQAQYNYPSMNQRFPGSTPMNPVGYPQQFGPGFGHMPFQSPYYGPNNGMFGYPGMMPGMMGSPFFGSGYGMMGIPHPMQMGASFHPAGYPMGGMPFGNSLMSAYPSQMTGFNPMYGGIGPFGAAMGAGNPGMTSMGPWAYLSGYNSGYSAQEMKECSRRLKKQIKEYLKANKQMPETTAVLDQIEAKP